MAPYDDLKEAIERAAFVTSGPTVRITASEEGASASWLFDLRALLLQGKWLDRYAEIFWERYASKYPFQVCGMESAGISLVAAIVMKGVERGTPVNGFYVRKSRKRQGLMKQVEGAITNEPAIVVDDLINSGSSCKKMLKILDEASVRVTDISTVIAFRGLDSYAFATERGIAVSSFFTLEDFGLPLLSSPAEDLAEPFDVVWHFKAKNPSLNFVLQKSAPMTDGQRIYFGSDEGIFYALNTADGSVAWTFSIGKHPEGKGIFSSPALWDDTVFFGAYDGAVYALDRKTGAKRWSYEDADWIGSSPALAPEIDRLFIGLEFGLLRKRGGIACLSMKTGARIWQQRTSEYTHGSPLYIKEEGLVVVGSNDGIAYAYEAATGMLRWSYQARGEIKSSFAYDQGRKLVLFGSMDGVMYALSTKDGTPVFARETRAGIYSTPLVEKDTAYVASLDKCLYAIDLNSWKEKWVFETNGRIFSSPAMFDGSIWIGSNDGRLYEIDPANGAQRSMFQATERIVNKVAYDTKTARIFMPTIANELYCLTRASEIQSKGSPK